MKNRIFCSKICHFWIFLLLPYAQVFIHCWVTVENEVKSNIVSYILPFHIKLLEQMHVEVWKVSFSVRKSAILNFWGTLKAFKKNFFCKKCSLMFNWGDTILEMMYRGHVQKIFRIFLKWVTYISIYFSLVYQSTTPYINAHILFWHRIQPDYLWFP